MESQHQDVQRAVRFVFNSKNRRPSRKVDGRKKIKKIQAFAEQAAGTMRDTQGAFTPAAVAAYFLAVRI